MKKTITGFHAIEERLRFYKSKNLEKNTKDDI